MDYDFRDKKADRGDGDPIWDVLSGVNLALDESNRLKYVDKTGWPPKVLRLLQEGVDDLHHATRKLSEAAKLMDRTKMADWKAK